MSNTATITSPPTPTTPPRVATAAGARPRPYAVHRIRSGDTSQIRLSGPGVRANDLPDTDDARAKYDALAELLNIVWDESADAMRRNLDLLEAVR